MKFENLIQDYLSKLKGFPIKDTTSAWVKNGEEYLLLRLDPHYKYCPDNWDIYGVILDNKNLTDNDFLRNIKEDLGIQGKIIQKFLPYLWLDIENRLWWIHRNSYLIEVYSKRVSLNPKGKYSGAKWIYLEDLKKFDRLNYLETIADSTLFRK